MSKEEIREKLEIELMSFEEEMEMVLKKKKELEEKYK